jgi:outer membrane protein assembly factor BamB
MNEPKTRFRFWTLLVPPVAIVLLWLRPTRLWRKLLGSIGLLLLTIGYVASIIFLLIRFTGLEVEWRGGYIPALTYHKTRPNFEALERSRTNKTNAASLNSPGTIGVSKAYWTSFRGPLNDGHYQEQPILTNWPSSGLKLLWRQPIGGGYGSFAIANGVAFTIEQRRENEVIAAYEIATGREVWTHSWPAHFDESMGGDGPRSTPSWGEGKLYALGALGHLACLNCDDGREIWSRNVLSENSAPTPTYGVAASPLLFDHQVLVLAGAGRGHSLVTYDRKDGHPIWSTLDDVTGYSTPMLVTLDGERQIVVSLEKRTVGLNPDDGKVLWEYPWQVLNKQLPIAQPVILSSNRFLLSAGYFTGCAAVEVKRQGTQWTAQTIWKNKNLKNKFSSSVLWQGAIYGLDEDMLTCLDAATGERRWKDGRYGYGQLLLASGHLLILGGEGELALVQAIPDRFHELVRFQAISGKTWNYPAISGGRLLVRNGAEMACFDLSN